MAKIIPLFILVALLYSCDTKKQKGNDTPVDNSVNENKAKQTLIKEKIPLNQIGATLATIPSANQITATIKASGAPFSALTLNNPINAQKYTSNFRKAINLGIYGTDLGYIGVYNRDDLLGEHLQVIQKLATELDLNNFIDKTRLEEIRANDVLTDSIFALTSDVFKQMDAHLRDNERHNTSLLLVVGSWLEAIHIAATVTYNSKFDNETLNTKIGEQKLILKQFIMLLNNFEHEPFFGQLIDDLTQLMLLYEGVDLDEDILTKAMTDTTGKYINTKSTEITHTQLAKITIKLHEIRLRITNPA